MISGLVCGASKNKFEQLDAQKKIAVQQIELTDKAISVQLASAQSKIDQAKRLSTCIRSRPRRSK